MGLQHPDRQFKSGRRLGRERESVLSPFLFGNMSREGPVKHRKKANHMNYIVFDLEWNQAAYKIDEEGDIPFEIIEIGAAKLNEKMERVDTFHTLIRPQVYPFLLRRTKELTGWTDKDLDEKGIYFEEACERFLQWCGKEYVFCSWGPGDVTQLERNMAYYKIRIPWKYPVRFLDVQKLYALDRKEGKTRRTLEYAVTEMEIPAEGTFHHAIDDAKNTAAILSRLPFEELISYYSIDYYRIPKNRFEERTFQFKTYSKFVSKAYPLKEEVFKNRRIRELYCFECGKRLTKVVPWFSDNGRSYVAIGECKEHGLLCGKIRVRVTEDYLGYFGVRTIKKCTPENEEMIRKKREHLSEKRKEHRKRSGQKKKQERTAIRAALAAEKEGGKE